MKMQRDDRTLIFTELEGPVNEMHVQLTYNGDSNVRNGITLDHTVLPELVKRFHAYEKLLSALEEVIPYASEEVEAQEDDFDPEHEEMIASAREVIDDAILLVQSYQRPASQE